MTTVSKAILELLRDTPNVTYTPQLLRYEALKRDIFITYENAKKILQRFARRGIVQRVGRGQYIFSGQRDTMSHSKGQKGTKLRGMSHSSRASTEQGEFEDECDKGTYHSLRGEPSLFKRMLAVLSSESMRRKTVTPRDFTKGPYLHNIGNAETKRRYFYRLVKMGVLQYYGRGRYHVNVDLVRELLEGTALGVKKVEEVTTPSGERDRLITISHHFRVKKAIPLTDEELDRIFEYFWKADETETHINGIKVKIYPTGSGDRSHAIKMVTVGAIFHVTLSYKKKLAKVMIYPKWREAWTFYAEAIFGKKFVERAIRIGISSHFGFNLSEIKKVLYEGEEIKVMINRSDFGSSGDLEFEGVTEEGAELAKKLLETKLEAVGEVVDVFETVKRRLAEIEARLYFMDKTTDIEDLKKRIETLENTIAEIKDHVVLHTRYINLVMKSMDPNGGVEGYA